MYVLLACSIMSLSVFISKEFEFWKKSKPPRTTIMQNVRGFLKQKDIEKALRYCNAFSQCSCCRIVASGLAFYGKDMREIEDAINREITVEITRLEKWTIIVGTIANIAVYIGLFGTVLGIVNAFHGIANSGTAGLNIVIAGVAEALLNTAMGLAVAIPAVVFFNWIMRQIKTLTQEMDSTASELLTILGLKE